MGWPPGAFGFGALGSSLGPLEGYGYHIENVKWTALRLQFEINIAEPWGPWCRLQNTYDSPCLQLRTIGYGNADGACLALGTPQQPMQQQVDCGLVYLCATADACACSSAGCDVGTSPVLDFDVALRNNDGDGSVAQPQAAPIGPPVATHNVRLIRAPN